jgi:hypothetical protein
MNFLRCVCFIALTALQVLPANAQTLRCNGQSAEVGDSRLSVFYKCGEPLLKDSYCAPVYYSGTLDVVPQPYANYVVPCQYTEEWVYDRGPGSFMATVRFRSGVVQSITYARTPR